MIKIKLQIQYLTVIVFCDHDFSAAQSVESPPAAGQQRTEAILIPDAGQKAVQQAVADALFFRQR
jgi:hypothetical protein